MKNNLFIFILFLILSLFIINPLFSQDTLNPKATIIEDWETGDFSQYFWQFIGAADWVITDLDPYEGTYCAQSGIITHNQQSTIYLVYEVYSQQEITFWLKVSSEQDFDFLRFYIDGVEQGYWSGEVSWQEVSFPVAEGIHTFKWEYDKDVTISNGLDACWVDYITFPPVDIEAFFYADITTVCKNDITHFFDQSIGPITQWNWTFEGGVPSSSTEQNPIITYPTVGDWDVHLEVSDGAETGQLSKNEYINIVDVPDPPPTITGISSVCASWGNTSYNTVGISGLTEYDWILYPPEAGDIYGDGTNINVSWEEDFIGVAELSVAAINDCGLGAYTEPYLITRYFPDVSVMLPAFVALSTPAFELTGGIPLGGDYTGQGVSNGMFDPAVAGLGTHTITYTITDINFCSNFAIDSITVTEFTGVVNQLEQNAFNIYPNPNSGSFKVKLNLEQNDFVNLRIYNALNSVVFEENDLMVGQSFTKDLALKNLTKGVYYLHIDGKRTKHFKKLVIQ